MVLIALFFFDAPFSPSAYTFSLPPSSLHYICCEPFWCSWLWRVASLLTTVLSSMLWVDKSWYCKRWWLKSSGRGISRMLDHHRNPDPGKINKWECTQKPPQLQRDKAPLKSQQLQCRHPMLILHQNQTQPWTLTDRLHLATPYQTHKHLYLATGYAFLPETRDPASFIQNTDTSFLNQETLHKPVAQPTHRKADSTVKRNYDLAACRKKTQTQQTKTK